ncbi:MAG: M13 family metallopeptidase [Usitatibacter sp.]
MRKLTPLLLAPIAVAAFAQQPDTPLTSFPYTPGLDVTAMDRDADPCNDFYQYTCGGWMKNNPIPPDQSSWHVYRKLGQDNQRFLWGILDESAKMKTRRSPVQQKIGDYFAACMDEDSVEKLGAAPLKPMLDRIDAVKSRRELATLLAELHMSTGDSGLFFGVGANQDFADSTKVITFAAAGGLSLPDRDYYLKDDEKSKEIRAKYLQHVTRVFQLLGGTPESAKRDAGTVMAIETALAMASLTRLERRDPYKQFHKMDLKGLKALTPEFDWDAYFKKINLSRTTPRSTPRGPEVINVTQPEFFKELDLRLKQQSLDDIKAYLRWHLASNMAPYLSQAFVNENFDFFSKTLHGTPQLRPRWKRCVALVDSQLGEALGQEFVRRAFTPQMKAKTLRMTLQIEAAMADDIRSLPWMSDITKKRALEKLHSIVNKIGYPDKWRDYSSVTIKPADFFGNVVRATRFETKRDINKIGKPVNRGEWQMTPPTVNAYYDAQLNDINFAAGVLQPPLFDPRMDDAPNYGNTGTTIGHELTHGFDDEGRKFDARGNLKDWWTEADALAFEERAQCIRDQYSQYPVVDELKINGALTSGEDIADLGGIILAWMAWKTETIGKKLENIEGLTPEQRFFVGYSQWACENKRPEAARVQALTDPHSPGKYRVNGLMVNLPEFQAAFACKPGAAMVAAKRCRVW